MITETGQGLSVLIVADVLKDWQTFASWYSFYKNLPLATITICALRNGETPFQLYQWTKRLNIPLFFHTSLSPEPTIQMLDCIREAKKRKLVGNEILAIPCFTLAIDVLSQKILNIINSQKVCKSRESAFFVSEIEVADLIDGMMLSDEKPFAEVELCVEAKEAEKLNSLVSCRKGCGKWIDTSKGCPFSCAAGLTSVEMTANENRIIELWKKMCSLYSAAM